SGIAKPIREGTPNVPNEVVNVGEAALAIKEWADGAFNFRREFGDESLQSDVESDEAFNNNDLFYTEHMLDTIDTFPTDSKKFFDMMERLAEYRMRREDALQDLVDGHGSSASAIEATYDAHTRSGMSSHTWVRRARESARQQRRCPDCHGEISECEEQPPCFPATTKASTMSTFVRKHPESGAIIHSLDGLGAEDFLNSLDDSDYEDIDDDDEEDEDEDEDDELDETDDDFDDLDSEGAEREAEEGRKVFQLFAARLFEQRVINAYREKVALDRQQNLIKELEEEEKRNAMKDKRKQIKKEQEKERKRKSQLKKEEERMAKESKVKAEQQRKREADEKKHQEMMAKKREQDIKMKKAQEERNRKILEEADRRMEREKAERKRSEEEMYEREKERKQAIEQKRQEELQKREKKQ
ncbi:Stress response protein nst1, partial [Kickxella alabastrina]